jgi:antitoxin VapB
MTEHEVAGILDHQIHAAGMNPMVTLVASDERISSYRHPIPTSKKLQRTVMVVTCAEQTGLISCLTRFVYFTKPTPDELARHQAVCDIDATVILATKPGRTLGQIFIELQQAYESAGYGGQWRFHHQGGATGYAPREAVANPTSVVPVLENQAFAWNPSVTGAKSEDTILCTANGNEVLNGPSKQRPQVTGRGIGGTVTRAGILAM